MGTASNAYTIKPANAQLPLWIAIAGLIYALVCPVSGKYFEPFHNLLAWRLHGLPRWVGGNNIAAGSVLMRVLLLTPFVCALGVTDVRTRSRWHAVATGVYWPLIVPTMIMIAGAGYGIIFAWLALPIHIAIAIAACVAVNRRMERAGRWIWLGVVAGFALWLLANWL